MIPVSFETKHNTSYVGLKPSTSRMIPISLEKKHETPFFSLNLDQRMLPVSLEAKHRTSFFDAIALAEAAVAKALALASICFRHGCKELITRAELTETTHLRSCKAKETFTDTLPQT